MLSNERIEAIRVSHVILSETKDLAEPWRLHLGTDPSPLAQDDRLSEGDPSHIVFVKCLKDQIYVFTLERMG